MNERLKGGEQLAALAALRTETPNLHDAWRWLIVQRDLDRLHALLPAMILYHDMGGRPAGAQEVIDLLLDVLRALGYVPGDNASVPPPDTSGALASADASLLALTLAALCHFDQAPEHEAQRNVYQRQSLDIVDWLPGSMTGYDPAEKACTLLLNSMWGGVLTFQQCVDLGQESIDIFGRLGDAWGTALAQLIVGDVANWRGLDADLARRSYQASLEGFRRLGNDWGRALCLNGLAVIEQRAGHLEDAYRMGCQSLDICCQLGDTWREVFVRQILIEIGQDLGAFDDARQHLKANLDHFARMGAAAARDDCLERLARLEERARAAAPDDASDSQLQGTAAAVHVPAFATARQPALADRLVEPLSARELEVLDLLAEGLTNREIAKQLYVSPNTVRVHTFHIYGKLGVNNRTQAATRARELGLLSTP
jgi:DNA-binding CsgD family transcriptional regulator